MTCEQVSRELSALIDNECTIEQKEALLTHIAACEECRTEYERLKELRLAFSDLKVQLHDAISSTERRPVAEKAMEEIYKTEFPKNKKRFSFITRHLGTAAALFIIVCLFIFARKQDKLFNTDNLFASAPESTKESECYSSDEAINGVIKIESATSKDDGNNAVNDLTTDEEYKYAADTLQPMEPALPSGKAENVEAEIAQKIMFSNSLSPVSNIFLDTSDSQEVSVLLKNSFEIALSGDNFYLINGTIDEAYDLLYDYGYTILYSQSVENSTQTLVCHE